MPGGKSHFPLQFSDYEHATGNCGFVFFLCTADKRLMNFYHSVYLKGQLQL